MENDQFIVTASHGNIAWSIAAFFWALLYIWYKDKLTDRVKVTLLVITPVIFLYGLRFWWSYLGRLLDLPDDGIVWHPFFWEFKGDVFLFIGIAIVPFMALVSTWASGKDWKTWAITSLMIYFLSFTTAWVF